MKIEKTLLMAGLAFGVTNVFAKSTVDCTSPQDKGKQCAELDIVVRDFQVIHPDFENFSEEASVNLNASWTSPGYRDDPNWMQKRADAAWGCANADPGNGRDNSALGIYIGTDAYPIAMNPGIPSQLPTYLQTKLSATGQKAFYGEFDCGGKKQRGYEHEMTSCSKDWSQPVLVTPGMVNQYLTFNPELGDDMMYEPVISRARMACDNQYFDQWYADYDAAGNSLQQSNINTRMNTVLQLPLVAGTKNTFEIDYNWNNGGYFPLDVVDANNNWVAQFTGGQCAFSTPCQFGPQSLSIFCPPYQYQWAGSQKDYMGTSTAQLCSDWKANGGPKTPMAASIAAGANGTVGSRHLRNYNFTMMGYAKFKYNKGGKEVFEFTGDDDMWIFVDGVLVVDLGGTHLAASGKADMDYLSSWSHGCLPGQPLADQTGENQNCDLDPADGQWKNGSWHHLHFFYADRQTDGSNMKIHSTLSELAKSRYGQPAVGEAVVKVDDDGKVTNSIFLNTTLNPTTVEALRNSAATQTPAMVIVREVTDPNTGKKTQVVYGYIPSTFSDGVDKGADGVLYQFDGQLVAMNADGSYTPVDGGLLGGDLIAFNVAGTTEGLDESNDDGAIPTEVWKQLMAWSSKMTYNVTSSTGKAVEGFDPLEDWASIEYTAVAVVELIPDDPGISRPDFSEQSEKLTNAAGSDGLKEDQTADLVLVSIPAVPGQNPLTWAVDNADEMMKSGQNGGLPTSVKTKAGEVPVTATNVAGLNAGSGTTLCYNDGAGKKGSASSESCTSFSFATSQPFRVNIRVFDHLGNFVNQFNKSVTDEDFSKALGTGVKVAGCDDAHPLYGGTGAMLANIKVYPVSQDGRQLATGPYIYQVTVVMEKYEYCYMAGGTSPTIMNMPFMRSTETYRRGYRRAKAK